MGIEKAPLTANPRPQPRFYLCEDRERDGDDFGDRDGDGDSKAIPVSAPVYCHP